MQSNCSQRGVEPHGLLAAVGAGMVRVCTSPRCILTGKHASSECDQLAAHWRREKCGNARATEATEDEWDLKASVGPCTVDCTASGCGNPETLSDYEH